VVCRRSTSPLAVVIRVAALTSAGVGGTFDATASAGIKPASRPHDLPIVLELSGELDLAAVDGIETALADLDVDNDLVLDLSALTFCDCAGAAMIVRIAGRYARAGHSLCLIGAQGIVRRTLTLLRIHEYVRMDNAVARHRT
jgi:anti-anti-sigma factor